MPKAETPPPAFRCAESTLRPRSGRHASAVLERHHGNVAGRRERRVCRASFSRLDPQGAVQRSQLLLGGLRSTEPGFGQARHGAMSVWPDWFGGNAAQGLRRQGVDLREGPGRIDMGGCIVRG